MLLDEKQLKKIIQGFDKTSHWSEVSIAQLQDDLEDLEVSISCKQCSILRATTDLTGKHKLSKAEVARLRGSEYFRLRMTLHSIQERILAAICHRKFKTKALECNY